jgi:ankyrin repeat protein
MNNKRLISLTICWMLIIALVLCVESFATNTSGTDTEAEQHFEKANELRKVADYDIAITEYEKVINLSPDSRIAQDAQFWIGQSYFKVGQFDAALSAFEKIVEEYPDSAIVPSTKLMIERIGQAKHDKSFFEAVVKGNIEQVKSLIAKGANVNAKDDRGQTSLHLAVRNFYEEIVEFLISEGADVNASQTDASWTPLLDAASTGQTEVIKLLLQHGAKVDVGDKFGYTPLYYAMWSEEKDAIKALISSGADVNVLPSENDDPPLVYAVWEGNREAVKVLIDAGADVNYKDEGWTPLHWAIRSANAELAKLFIGKGVKIPAFHKAVLEGDLDGAKQLIESGMDVDIRDNVGCTPAYWALSVGRIEIFEYLLNKGADINAKTNAGRTLLLQASTAGYTDIVRQLITKGVDINIKDKHGLTPLQRAAYKGHTEIVKLLIDKGADVNVMAKNGTHPLGDAAFNGHEEVVRLLLASGADANLHSENRGAALHAAARNGYSTILDILIANGADVNLNAIRGTPLHRAIYGLANAKDIKVEIVKKLLAKGADVNTKEPQRGRTPLHIAALRGRLKAAELLIAAGADLNAKDNGGRTPLWFARDKYKVDGKATKMIELLCKHRAKER